MFEDPFHIVELQRKLDEAREEREQTQSQQPRLRIAAIQREKRRKKELENKMTEMQARDLLNEGLECQDIASILNVPIVRVASIQKYDQERRMYLATGRFSDQSGYICITPGLPTPRY
jgi:hypothetical protein